MSEFVCNRVCMVHWIVTILKKTRTRSSAQETTTTKVTKPTNFEFYCIQQMFVWLCMCMGVCIYIFCIRMRRSSPKPSHQRYTTTTTSFPTIKCITYGYFFPSFILFLYTYRMYNIQKKLRRPVLIVVSPSLFRLLGLVCFVFSSLIYYC